MRATVSFQDSLTGVSWTGSPHRASTNSRSVLDTVLLRRKKDRGSGRRGWCAWPGGRATWYDPGMEGHDLDEDGAHDEDACYRCLMSKEVKNDCRCGKC